MLLCYLLLSALGVLCYFVYRVYSSIEVAPKVESVDITSFPKKYDEFDKVGGCMHWSKLADGRT